MKMSTYHNTAWLAGSDADLVCGQRCVWPWRCETRRPLLTSASASHLYTHRNQDRYHSSQHKAYNANMSSGVIVEMIRSASLDEINKDPISNQLQWRSFVFGRFQHYFENLMISLTKRPVTRESFPCHANMWRRKFIYFSYKTKVPFLSNSTMVVLMLL